MCNLNPKTNYKCYYQNNNQFSLIFVFPQEIHVHNCDDSNSNSRYDIQFNNIDIC